MRVFWLVVLAGVVVRVCLMALLPDVNAGTDAWKYDRIARNIALKGIYSMSDIKAESPLPTAIYPPLYPAIKSLSYRLFGFSAVSVNCLHIALYVIACIVIFRISSLLFNEATGIFGVLFFTLEPVSVYYSVAAMPEIVIAILLPLSVYFLIRFLRQRQKAERKIRYGHALLSGILLGLTALTKPIVFYLPLFFVLCILICLRKAVRKSLIASLIFVLGALLLVSPWIARNYMLWKSFTFATADGFVSPEEGCAGEKLDYVVKRFKDTPRLAADSVLRYAFGTSTRMFYRTHGSRDSGEEARHQEGSTVRDYVRIFRLSWRFAGLEFLLLAVLLTIYAFSSRGIFLLARGRKAVELSAFLLVLAYFFVIALFTVSNSRYRFPAIPFYSILAGYGVSGVMKKKGGVL